MEGSCNERVSARRQRRDSDSRDRRGGRTDRSRQAQRRTGEQKPVAVMGAQPIGQLGQVEHFPQITAEFEQTMGVQRKRGAEIIKAWTRGGRLDTKVIRNQSNRATVGDPLTQLLIAAVEGTGGVE